ncbi:glycosyltransferase family 87 protein [Longispora sp. K20-0274]|uniref:glycosyltransferase 87 family protein n=1 Tax=Longispora sp. K20-0274 TaxID=3088255 RepID=UPI00399AE8EA
MLALCWISTRIFLCLQLGGPKAFFYIGDVGLYEEWSRSLADGTFPTGDSRWQYPPLAAVFMVLPRILPGGYLTGFVALVLGADAVILLALGVLARRRGSWLGCWYWTVGPTLLGAVVLGRFDVFPAVLAVLALVAAGSATAWGGLVGTGVALKVWPLALLAGTPPVRYPRAFLAMAAAGGGITLAFVLLTGGAMSFLRGQEHRGLEFEAVLANPFVAGRTLGLWNGTVRYQYGSVEVVGAHVDTVARLSFVVVALAAVGFVVWRWRLWRSRAAWRPELAADAALCAVLLMVLSSRVLSPQYLIWLLAVAAVCLACAQTSQRPTAGLILAATVLTFLEYRVFWFELVAGEGFAVALLTTRNALLVAAAAIGAWRLWRGVARRDRADAIPAAVPEPVLTGASPPAR